CLQIPQEQSVDRELTSSAESESLYQTLSHSTQGQLRRGKGGRKSFPSDLLTETQDNVYIGGSYATGQEIGTQTTGGVKTVRALDSGAGLSCRPTKTTVSVNLETLQQDSDGLFQCLWCPFQCFQREDRARHIQQSHSEEYTKLLREKYSHHMNCLSVSLSRALVNVKLGSPSEKLPSGSDCSSFERLNLNEPRGNLNIKSGHLDFSKPEPSDCSSFEHLNLNEPRGNLNIKSGHLDFSKPESSDCKFSSLEMENTCSNGDFCKNTDFKHSSFPLTVHTVTNVNLNSKLRNRSGTNGKLSGCDESGREYQNITSPSTCSREKAYNYKCDVCGKGFRQSSGLCKHKKTHSGKKPFKCDVCGKGFGQSGHLSNHKRIHSGEKPFKCDVCGMGFRRSSHLSRHKGIHSDEKLYKCDVCGKGFSQSGILSNHKRIHSGEKPFKCHLCGKGFSQSSNFSRHMLIHKGEKPHKCDVCGKAFRQGSQLSYHKRTHSGEKPYKCDVCETALRTMESVMPHCDVRSACIHHTQSHYSDIVPTRLSTEAHNARH
ncbi:zinc finger protein 431, partial [Elysia marginata]